jgi:hypothetical protein
LAYEARPHSSSRSLFTTYGTAGLGLDLTAEAWPQLEQLFVSDADGLLLQGCGRPSCPMWPSVSRLSKTCLRDNPVDMLVLGALTTATHEAWRLRIPLDTQAPKLVIEFWPPESILDEAGPMSKLTNTKWTTQGYHSSCRAVNALQLGGVVDRQWLLVARVRRE